MGGYIPRVDILRTYVHVGYIPRVAIPRVDIFHAWLYTTRGYMYSTRGTTRDVYVPRY